MKFLALVPVFGGLAMAAPALINLNLGGSSGPLVGVAVGSATVVAVGGSAAKPSDKAVTTTMAVAPTSTLANPTGLPSTFSAPIQGQGTLSAKNLPALPAVIDKTFAGVLGSVYGLVSGLCSQDYKCTITVAGSIQSLLVDGDQYAGSTTISAWCDGGHCYGSANPTLSGTAPFDITCNGDKACSATISGAASAIFTNGRQLELWGWLTPAGYCQNGICTASIDAFGDPMY